MLSREVYVAINIPKIVSYCFIGSSNYLTDFFVCIWWDDHLVDCFWSLVVVLCVYIVAEPYQSETSSLKLQLEFSFPFSLLWQGS